MSSSSEVGTLLRRLEPVRRDLAAHRLYAFLTKRENIHVFMEHQVYAVWDFMTLLKALQRHLTCVEANWRPTSTAAIRRLVNEIVLEEESDEINGVVTSQFELYRSGMRQAGADGSKIDSFVAEIGSGSAVEAAITRCDAPPAVGTFVRATQTAIETYQPHIIVAAFALGWEDAVANVFCPILAAIPEAEELETFELFLRRRIERNRRGRGSMAIAMLSQLCGDDAMRWREAAAAGIDALAARAAFWTAIARTLEHAPECAPAHARANARTILN